MRVNRLFVLASSITVVALACSGGGSVNTGVTGTLSTGSGTGNAGTGGGAGSGTSNGGSSATLSGTGAASTSASTSAASTSSAGTGGSGGGVSTSSGTMSTSSGTMSSSGMSTSSSSSGATSSSSGGGTTFGSQCMGAATTLTGTVYAPNGIDPIPNVRVYAAIQINPYPTNYCDSCSSPIDPAYVSTKSAADGTFSLNIDQVPAGVSIDFAIQIGRFRKHTILPVTACMSQAVPKPDETLPGNSMAGDIPHIAVSQGNVDHLDTVLSALGITEYDCYEGRANPPNPANTATCPLTLGKKIADVLSNAATLDAYHMAFLSCAPDAYGTYTTPTGTMYVDGTHSYPGQGYNKATMTANTQAWVAAGGRMFVTDTAYDYVAQAFPPNITWEGPGGSPQPVDGANVGCAPAGPPPMNLSAHAVLYPATIDDPTLAAWLKVVGFASSPSVQIQGFYEPWSVMASLQAPPATVKIADGTMPIDTTYPTTKCANPTMTDVPLTAQFDVPTCGRVIFSSYHTYTGTGTMAANEKIMEFLIFGAAVCHN